MSLLRLSILRQPKLKLIFALHSFQFQFCALQMFWVTFTWNFFNENTLFHTYSLIAGSQQPQQIFSPGQIIRNPGVLPTNLQTVQLSNGQSVAVRPSISQVVQFPMQQTIPVQVPISSGNGQTIYQTIHFPVQLATAAVPNIIQAQQIMPQVANIITPNGQLQQVQIATSAPAQTQSVSQNITVQADSSQPLTFTGANGQQFTVIPAANLQHVRGTNIGNIIQVPNIQTIPTVQNIPGKCFIEFYCNILFICIFMY